MRAHNNIIYVLSVHVHRPRKQLIARAQELFFSPVMLNLAISGLGANCVRVCIDRLGRGAQHAKGLAYRIWKLA